jgi:hypothetical protein
MEHDEKEFIEKMKRRFFGYGGNVDTRIKIIMKDCIEFAKNKSRETCKMIEEDDLILHKRCSGCDSYMSRYLQNDYCPYCGRRVEESDDEEQPEFIDNRSTEENNDKN